MTLLERRKRGTSTPQAPHAYARSRARAGALLLAACAPAMSATGPCGRAHAAPAWLETRARGVVDNFEVVPDDERACAAPQRALPSLLPGSQRCACLGFSSVALPPLQFGGCWRGAAAYRTRAPSCSVPSPLSSWAPERRASPPSGRQGACNMTGRREPAPPVRASCAASAAPRTSLTLSLSAQGAALPSEQVVLIAGLWVLMCAGLHYRHVPQLCAQKPSTG